MLLLLNIQIKFLNSHFFGVLLFVQSKNGKPKIVNFPTKNYEEWNKLVIFFVNRERFFFHSKTNFEGVTAMNLYQRYFKITQTIER